MNVTNDSETTQALLIEKSDVGKTRKIARMVPRVRGHDGMKIYCVILDFDPKQYLRKLSKRTFGELLKKLCAGKLMEAL